MVWSLNRCNGHKFGYFTRNIFNRCVEGFKILFEASSQASSATLTTVWGPGLILINLHINSFDFKNFQVIEIKSLVKLIYH